MKIHSADFAPYGTKPAKISLLVECRRWWFAFSLKNQQIVGKSPPKKRIPKIITVALREVNCAMGKDAEHSLQWEK